MSLLPPADTVLKRIAIPPNKIAHIRPRARKTHCRAIINWLSRYQPTPEATNLDQVKGYIEAFHHLCAIDK